MIIFRQVKIVTYMYKFLGRILKKGSGFLNKPDISLGIYIILLLAFIARIVNLNYNTAFNDEAIYIVIGRLGLFENDWWSYGAKLWMAGIPYIYPPMTALAYEVGGLVGSRLLNVILGVIFIEEVYRFVKLLNLFDKKTNTIAALIAAFLVAFSGLGFYVSRLATYDMPSFLLFFLGMNSFLKARSFSNGKYYFLSFLFLFLAFLTKIIIAVFFPILFVISILMLKNRPDSDKKAAITYLFIPMFIAGILYLIFYWDNLMTYIFTHKDLGKTEGGIRDIIELIWRETYQPFLFAVPAGIALLGSLKARKAILGLVPLILIVPVFHIVLTRFATLDKHLYLVVAFLSVIVGYGVGYILTQKNKTLGKISFVIFAILLTIYILTGQKSKAELEQQWKNTDNIQEFLKARVKPGDKILTEEGATTALALYDIIFPPKSVVTFDWIQYSGLENDEGYFRATKEGYFDYIELDGQFEGADELRDGIKQNMKDNYSLIYKEGTFEIYARKEN